MRPDRPRELCWEPTPTQLSRPVRPHTWMGVVPRALAFGLSPGLDSADPLGRGCLRPFGTSEIFEDAYLALKRQALLLCPFGAESGPGGAASELRRSLRAKHSLKPVSKHKASAPPSDRPRPVPAHRLSKNNSTRSPILRFGGCGIRSHPAAPGADPILQSGNLLCQLVKHPLLGKGGEFRTSWGEKRTSVPSQKPVPSAFSILTLVWHLTNPPSELSNPYHRTGFRLSSRSAPEHPAWTTWKALIPLWNGTIPLQGGTILLSSGSFPLERGTALLQGSIDPPLEVSGSPLKGTGSPRKENGSPQKGNRFSGKGEGSPPEGNHCAVKGKGSVRRDASRSRVRRLRDL